jgi:hypothetical protein
LITHSLVFLIVSKLWFDHATTHPTIDGENPITVCQPRVMMLDCPFVVRTNQNDGPRFEISPGLFNGKIQPLIFFHAALIVKKRAIPSEPRMYIRGFSPAR